MSPSDARDRKALDARITTTTEPLPIRIRVTVHHPEPLLAARSETHDVIVDFDGDRTVIETTKSEVPSDRPFRLEFAVNDRESPTVASYLRSGDEGRLGVEAVVSPPEQPRDGSARPKQIVFIMDSSGSMAHETKIDQARAAVLSCVEQLDDQDRFNVVEFDDDFHFLAEAPLEPTAVERRGARDWLDRVEAKGGTKLLPALAAALAQPDDPDRHRMFVVVTDGMLADETEALALLEKKLGEGRLFVVGTGRRVRQETLLRLAEYGRGAATFAGDAASLGAAVSELFASIAQPLGWDVALDWDGPPAAEIVPSRLPDLYAGRPVRVLAWFDEDLPSSLRLRMKTTDGEKRFEVLLPPRTP
jgi:Ca-activated chloride channel family protein